jgi:hypothetical protein
MAERKVIIGRCATTTLPKICDICGIYGFLSRHRDGQPRSFTPGINWQGAAPPRDSLHERKVIAFGADPAIVCAERIENGGSAGSIGDPPTAPWRGRFTSTAGPLAAIAPRQQRAKQKSIGVCVFKGDTLLPNVGVGPPSPPTPRHYGLPSNWKRLRQRLGRSLSPQAARTIQIS